MISLNEKKDCCGCGACVQRCPKHCIILRPDSEGFLYPQVDSDVCVECGLCENVCPILHPYENHEPLQVLAAVNKDDQVRLQSSSGGIFTLLAEQVIKDGGVVFGARFDESWQVVLDFTETLDGLASFRGSKYVQSRTGETFLQCERFLKSGRKVLYSGTPCQISGLKHFLRREYDNLVTVDFLCHGAPSPKVWAMYLDETLKSLKRTDQDIPQISDIKFRDKSNGWREYNLLISFDSPSYVMISSPWRENSFMKAFIGNLILRPSCYTCPSRSGKSNSDITIGDYWGVEKRHPELDDNNGTSIVFVNTMKGRKFMSVDSINCVSSSLDGLDKINSGLQETQAIHPKRSDFFSKLCNTENVSNLINKSLLPSFSTRVKISVWRVLSNFSSLLVTK